MLNGEFLLLDLGEEQDSLIVQKTVVMARFSGWDLCDKRAVVLLNIFNSQSSFSVLLSVNTPNHFQQKPACRRYTDI